MSELDKNDKPRKKAPLFFLWWKTDPENINYQVANYKTLQFSKSSRKISTALFIFSGCLTAALTALNAAPWVSYADAGICFILAFFIYQGSANGLLAAAAYWTLSKGYIVYQNPLSFVGQYIWWCLYMQQIYSAWLVENKRQESSTDTKEKASA